MSNAALPFPDDAHENFKGRPKHPEVPDRFDRAAARNAAEDKVEASKPAVDYSKQPLRMIITRGFPGSGKSTWAKAFVQANENFVRINRDDIRTMMFGTNQKTAERYNEDLEDAVKAGRDHLIAAAMCAGVNVVVDETGVYKRSLDRLWKLSDAIEAECGVPVNVEFRTFLHVSIEECIARDAKRETPVGEEVIRAMLKKYLEEEEESQTE